MGVSPSASSAFFSPIHSRKSKSSFYRSLVLLLADYITLFPLCHLTKKKAAPRLSARGGLCRCASAAAGLIAATVVAAAAPVVVAAADPDDDEQDDDPAAVAAAPTIVTHIAASYEDVDRKRSQFILCEGALEVTKISGQRGPSGQLPGIRRQ